MLVVLTNAIKNIKEQMQNGNNIKLFFADYVIIYLENPRNTS